MLILKLHLSQLQTVESERNLLQRQWEESVLQIQNLSDDLNQSRSQSLQEMATLRKSLESSTMERDAAIVSRVCWLSLSVDVRIDIVSGCKEIPLKIVSNFISKNVWVVVIVPKPVFRAPHLAVLKSSLLKSSLVTLHGI